RYDSHDLNVGVVVGDDGLLIIDTRESHRMGAELLADLTALGRGPVRWVVNSHWHWDHTFGNALFPDSELWGHERCAMALRDHGLEMKADIRPWFGSERRDELEEVEIVPPTNTFSDRVSLDIGRQVEMSYHGLGHTDGDIVVRVADADVSFFGDLVEEGAPPSFGDSYPNSWPETLRTASEETSGTVVPGHGDIVDRGFVESQIEELEAVATIARALVAKHMPFDEATALGPYSAEVMTVALRRAQAVG
ncbi:MAG: MBL fold metallo-hydrolase, partial [Acidimicrobiia bacterium]